MNKDHKLLEEAYQSIYESVSEPLYFGPPKRKEEFLRWLNRLPRTIHPDGSVSVEGDVNLSDLKFNSFLKLIFFHTKCQTGNVFRQLK